MCFEGSPTASGSAVSLAVGLKRSILRTIMCEPVWPSGKALGW